MVRIPAGATNIDVRQHSFSGKSEDDNYLGKRARPLPLAGIPILWSQSTGAPVGVQEGVPPFAHRELSDVMYFHTRG